MLEIVPLTPADAAEYRELRLRALRDHPEAFTSSHEEESQQPLEVARERLTSDHTSFWGAWRHRELCGMVGLLREPRPKNRHKATVVAMYVAPEARGHDAGRRLLQALVAQARQEGLASLVLTVTEGNDEAQRLYAAAGFRSFGVEPRAVRIDGRFLAKNHMILELDPA
ncbi:GNAT family N-acetyltransferase [Ramlibacter sp. Leaf400]|uniref:GNAT family N-acetyltransferase n=1 Tax=Ramlibacter sp. Leaf400 TaxID=1736365 RepID=UPI001F1CAAF9|nr:GNAT family N-acetyltransferase [Ramlibacter sp. Leaf400]